ncbi:MAG: DUF2336 domain-containing protein [Alphaproteobacteria bacterium]
MAQLTADLITRLREDDSPEVRRETVTLLTTEFNHPDLQPGEQRLAEAIFRIMVRDADVGVRRALAEGLKDNPAVPAELALTLARDVAEVAVPMLHYSIVFSDKELVEIARSQPEAWQQAVARRASVSAPVSEALVDKGSESVVVTLVRNQGAIISEGTSNKVIDRFSQSEAVMTGLVQRPSFPPKLAERLIAVVSAAIRQSISELPGLPTEIADQLITQGQENLTLDIELPDPHQDNLEQLVRQMDVKGRLTPSLVLRSLCTGHLGFFEVATARRAGIDPDNARALIAGGSQQGATALCKAAKLPNAFSEVVAIAGQIRSTIADLNAPEGRQKFQEKLIEACRVRYPDLPDGDVEALIAKLSPALGRRK